VNAKFDCRKNGNKFL